MKSDSWLLIIIRSLEKVQTLRVEKRTLIILALGGIVFAGGLAFFAYEYFSLLYGRDHLIDEVQKLKKQTFALEQKLKRTSPENIPQKPHPPPVVINELEVIRRGDREGFAVRFRLVNQHPQGNPLSGTLAMVAKNETLRTPIYRVIPEMRLNKGIPQQPEKGSRFEVKNQKFVEAFFDASSEATFKALTVYVYSADGKLILQKSTEIPEE